MKSKKKAKSKKCGKKTKEKCKKPKCCDVKTKQAEPFLEDPAFREPPITILDFSDPNLGRPAPLPVSGSGEEVGQLFGPVKAFFKKLLGRKK